MEERLLENEMQEDNRVEKRNNKNNMIRMIAIILPIVIAILSCTLISNVATSNKMHENTISTLNEKQVTILKLSAGSASIAAVASLALGDRATAISSKLLDLTGYFVVILCAILFEKYMVTTMGFLSFKIIIPIACIIFSIFTIIDREVMRKIALKLILFAIVAFLVVPTSVAVSNIIEKTYETNIKATVEYNDVLEKELTVESNNENVVTEEQNSNDNLQKNEVSTNNKNVLDNVTGFFEDAKNNIASTLGNAVSFVTDKAKEMVNKLTVQLNNTIDAIAVMLVTTCVIPICIIFFFIWILKMFFSLDFKIDTRKIPRVSTFYSTRKK